MSGANPSTDKLMLPVRQTEGETLEARMTGNAYNNTPPAHYLCEDVDSDLVETWEDLFPRVAKNIMLMEAAFEAEKRDIELTVTPGSIKPDHPRRDKPTVEVFGRSVTTDDNEAEMTLSVYNANKFAYDTFVPELPEEVCEVIAKKRETFEELMGQLFFMPNSPMLMNAGDELQQLSACFVDSPADDTTDIHQIAKEAAEMLQSGGGMGYTSWKLRPYGDATGSTGSIASGPITFMRAFDQMCKTIAQGDARRGVQMGTMRVSHPGVIQFLHAKNKDVSLAHILRLNGPDDFARTKFIDALDETRELIGKDGRVPKHLCNTVEDHLSSFDTSADITGGFMKALYNDGGFVFANLRTEKPYVATPQMKEIYDMFGLGEYVEVGEVLSVPAKELQDQIIEGAWENGEPDIVYLKHANEKHSFDVEKHPDHQILATNPRGEQPLEEYEACSLGHINPLTLVAEDPPDWRVWYDAHSDEYDSLEAATRAFPEDTVDREEFNHRIESGTCFPESIIMMSGFPVKKIEGKVRELHKIGFGVMGLAQSYIQLGVHYGFDEDNEIAQQFMTHTNHGSGRTPYELAKERGPFEAWEDSKYMNPIGYREWFEHHTDEDTNDRGGGYPIRNHNTTTTAPMDTMSMVSSTIGGCEPIHNIAYYKNVSDDVQGDEMLVGFDDYSPHVLEVDDTGVEAIKQEAQEQMANNQFDGLSSLSTVSDAISELFVVTSDLADIEHAGVQCILQSGVDSAISKTCNFPNNASKKDMDEVYRYIYDHGGKGATVCRDGACSKQVLITCAKNIEFSDGEEAAKTIASQIRDVFGNVEAFLDSEEVSDLIDSEPRLVFADSLNDVGKRRSRPDMLYGVTQRIDTGYGKLYININEDEHDELFELSVSIGNPGGFTAPFIETLIKATSTSLRSGIDPKEIVSELEGIRSPKVAWDKGEQINSILGAIGTVMQRYLDGDADKDCLQQQNPTEVETEAAAVRDANADTDGGVVIDNRSDSDAVADLLAAGGNPERPEHGGMDFYYFEGCKIRQNCGWSEY